MRKIKIRIHATNINGLGAIEFVRCLMDALGSHVGFEISKFYLPAIGGLSNYKPSNEVFAIKKYNRLIPRLFSRILEVTLFSFFYKGRSLLFVMGDIPLLFGPRQILLLHQSNITKKNLSIFADFRFYVAGLLIKLSQRKIGLVLVQSEAMRLSFTHKFPELSNRVISLLPPPPLWLLQQMSKSGVILKKFTGKLSLFYPASFYHHKNHHILCDISSRDDLEWPIDSLVLTIDAKQNPAPDVDWISCVGTIEYSRVYDCYLDSDALLFLSTSESLGLPLLEAIALNMPILCPDLPYAREICRDGAIYFDPNSIDSLNSAVNKLVDLLSSGWRPNWAEHAATKTISWDSYADAIYHVISSQVSS